MHHIHGQSQTLTQRGQCSNNTRSTWHRLSSQQRLGLNQHMAHTYHCTEPLYYIYHSAENPCIYHSAENPCIYITQQRTLVYITQHRTLAYISLSREPLHISLSREPLHIYHSAENPCIYHSAQNPCIYIYISLSREPLHIYHSAENPCIYHSAENPCIYHSAENPCIYITQQRTLAYITQQRTFCIDHSAENPCIYITQQRILAYISLSREPFACITQQRILVYCPAKSPFKPEPFRVDNVQDHTMDKVNMMPQIALYMYEYLIGLHSTDTHYIWTHNNNNNRMQRRCSRFCTISSQRHELSPTRTFRWPGRNRVQIMCNTSSAYHMQVSCYVPLGTKGQLSY